MRLVERSSVRVRVLLREEIIERQFQDVAVVLENAPRNVTVQPKVITVRLRGPQRYLDILKEDALRAVVDVEEELDRGEMHFTKTVTLSPLPERTEVLGPPLTVEIRRSVHDKPSP